MIELESRLGYTFRDRALLREALTHSSFGNVQGVPHNERLEFLGDSVLDLVCAEYLMLTRPGRDEGFMSQARAAMVSNENLGRCARRLGLHEHLLVSGHQDAIRCSDGVLARALEALAGAAYLDSGDIAAVRAIAVAAGVII